MEFDFSQNTEVDSLDKVPQDFRGLYVSVEGKEGVFKLDSDNEGVKSAVAAVQRLNTSLKAARADAKAKGDKAVDLSPLGEYGTTPQEIADAFTGKLTELQDQLNKKGDINVEKIKEDIAKAHSKDLEGKDKRIDALTTQLYGLMVENEATAAIAEEKGVPDLLLPFVKQNIKVIEEDGKFKVLVLDASGDRRYSGVTGEPMTIRELVAEMKANEKYGRLFESEAPSGPGIPQHQRKPGFQQKKENMSPTDKIAAGLSKRR